MRVPVGVLYYDHIVYYFRDKARYLSEYCQRLVTVDSWRYINIIYVCMYVKRLVRKNYTVHEKQSHRIISIILFRSDEILQKSGGFIPECSQDTTAVAYDI